MIAELHRPRMMRFQAIAVALTGLSVAVCLLLLVGSLGPWGLVLVAPPCWLFFAFHRAHRDRANEQRHRIHEMQELREALAHVKHLQGLIPICMHCKSIRDNRDTWHKIETYLAKHLSATFTHALCGKCRDEHYGEFLEVSSRSA